MPRGVRKTTSSRLAEFKAQVHTVLAALHKEIEAREKELAPLTKQLAQLSGLAGRRIAKTIGIAPTRKSRPARGGRTNWGDVLSKLPREFKASDVRKIGPASHKQASEIFAAITRWIEAGAVKRKARGVYTRVK
jgi:hypothetical protein